MSIKWSKAIVWGLPIEVRILKDGGAEVRGFWSYPYMWFLAPLESFTGGFRYFIYKGSYWKALWYYLMIKV